MVSKEVKQEIFSLQGGKCFHCGKELDRELDDDSISRFRIPKEKHEKIWRVVHIPGASYSGRANEYHIFCLGCVKEIDSGKLPVDSAAAVNNFADFPKTKHGKIVTHKKSVFLAVLLALIFNWLGLLYASTRYALYVFLMAIGYWVLIVLAVFFGQFGGVGLVIGGIFGVLFFIAPILIRCIAVGFAVSAVLENNRLWIKYEQEKGIQQKSVAEAEAVVETEGAEGK